MYQVLCIMLETELVPPNEEFTLQLGSQASNRTVVLLCDNPRGGRWVGCLTTGAEGVSSFPGRGGAQEWER